MRSPLGDQKGSRLAEEALNVNRFSILRDRSHSQISLLEPVERRNATALSSGEIEGSETAPGAPKAPRSFPSRSNQTICPVSELAYSSIPFSETVTSAKLTPAVNETLSATRSGSPET